MIGEKIRSLRKLNGYTLDKLAEISGIAKPILSKYENSYNEPNATNIRKLADAFDVSIDYLFSRDKKIVSEEDDDYMITVAQEEMDIILALRNPAIKKFREYLLSNPKRNVSLIASNKHVKEFIDMSMSVK